jgi:O-antigen/teichoic acid export membrane protein
MSQSIYRNLADQKKQPDAIGRAVAVPVRVMSNLIIGPAIFAAAIAPPLIGAVFGHDWVEAGQYLRWMTPWVTVTITFGAMTPVVSILGLQKMGLFFQVGSLLLGLAAMYLAGPAWGPVAAIAGFSLVKALSIILYRLHMFHLVGVSPRPIALSMLWQTAFFVATFGLAAAALETTLVEGVLRWLVVGALCLLAAGVYTAINLRSIAQLSPASEQRISAPKTTTEPERIE